MEHSVGQVKKFVEKVTVRNTKTRAAFGANEVRTLWEKLCNKHGSIETWSKLQLRSFTLVIFQHSTFCKVFIRCSKTDQAGNGSYVYVPKLRTGFRDPHMLMCVYIQKMELDKDVSTDMYLFPPLK
jgi:hypothetical protein